MRFALSLNHSSSLNETFKSQHKDNWLSIHTFEHLHHCFFLNVKTLDSIIINNISKYRRYSNAATFDEQQLTTEINSELMTKDPCKPKPFGISTKILAEPTANGRSFVTYFKIRNEDELNFVHVDMFKEVIALYQQQNITPCLTFDRAYSNVSLLHYLQKSNCCYTTPLKVNNSDYPLAYMKTYSPGLKQWSVFYHRARNEYLSVSQNSKGYNFTVSTAFESNGNHNSKKNTIYQFYHRTFNYVDVFNKVLQSHRWPFHQHSPCVVQLNGILSICAVNAWVMWTNVTEQDEPYEKFLQHVSAELLQLGNYSLHHKRFM